MADLEWPRPEKFSNDIEEPVSHLTSLDLDHLSSGVVSSSGCMLRMAQLATYAAPEVEMPYWSNPNGISMENTSSRQVTRNSDCSAALPSLRRRHLSILKSGNLTKLTNKDTSWLAIDSEKWIHPFAKFIVVRDEVGVHEVGALFLIPITFQLGIFDAPI